MAKYHFNKDTGKTGQCTAKVKCRLGLAESEHFETREEAQAAFEKTQNSSTLTMKKEVPKTVSIADLNIDLSSLQDKDRKQLIEKLNERYKLLIDVERGNVSEPKPTSPENFLVETTGIIRDRGSYFELAETMIKEQPYHISESSFAPETEYVVVVSARQGGGNRECYCDDYDSHEDGCLALNNEIVSEHPNYVTDYDDDFDSTYNYFIFDNKLTKKDVEEYRKEKSNHSEYSKLKIEKERLNNKLAPTWFVNDIDSYNTSLSEYKIAKREYDDSLQKLKKNKEIFDKAESIVQKIENKDFDSLSVEELQSFNTYQNRYSKYDLDKVKAAGKNIQEYEDMKKAYQQAEELEDGSELKEYLLGDRGTGSYNTTEKQGRRKVTVKRTYQRGSVLGKELESKKKLSEYAEKELSHFVEPFTNKADDYKNIFNSVADYRNAAEAARNKTWESGWVYDNPVPKMPKYFLMND